MVLGCHKFLNVCLASLCCCCCFFSCFINGNWFHCLQPFTKRFRFGLDRQLFAVRWFVNLYLLTLWLFKLNEVCATKKNKFFSNSLFNVQTFFSYSNYFCNGMFILNYMHATWIRVKTSAIERCFGLTLDFIYLLKFGMI